MSFYISLNEKLVFSSFGNSEHIFMTQILKFNDMEERGGFIMTLEGFLRDLKINREKHQFTEKTIMDEANTKEKRQELLDTFFRVVCLQVCYFIA